jgi:hypothetical protein
VREEEEVVVTFNLVWRQEAVAQEQLCGEKSLELQERIMQL